jgi:hypothetical protein
MQSADQSSPYRVADPGQTAAFDNPLRCRILVACGPVERSLSDLGLLLDVPLPKLHYHVARLLDAELLTVSRVQARAGRPVRFFRAIAERFLVPQESLPALPSEGWSQELRKALLKERGRAGEVALLYGPGAKEAAFEVRLMRPEAEGPARSMEQWRILKLTPAQRTALAQELISLLERYAHAAPEPGAESYLAHTAFAPGRLD